MRFQLVTRRALAPLLAVGFIAATGAYASGCGDDALPGLDSLCCTNFKPGANMVTVDWGLDAKANVQFGVFMQAVGDLSVASSGLITAVGVECEAMVKELGEAPPTLTEAQKSDPAEHFTNTADLNHGQAPGEIRRHDLQIKARIREVQNARGDVKNRREHQQNPFRPGEIAHADRVA